ncbi:MAG: SIR2 family protein, partial [Bacteroidales bacterium]|nr:SIR2 family protein [Bacteroidales bacterium]
PLDGEIKEIFEKEALTIFPLLCNPAKSIYSWIQEKDKYRNPCIPEKDQYGNPCIQEKKYQYGNFESNLYMIECLWRILNKSSKFPLKRFVSEECINNQIPPVLYYNEEKMTDKDFLNLYKSLISRLNIHFIEKSKELKDKKSEELNRLKSFFDKLQEKFDISYVTTNYDNVLTTRFPCNRTGFDKDGKFNRRLLFNEKWNYGIHLHGSVFFDMKSNKETNNLFQIYWNENLDNFNSNYKSPLGNSDKETKEGFVLNSTIIAGYDKVNQILREPFLSYFSMLEKLVYESDAILFIGYGFQDDHVNSVFSMLKSDLSKQRKVVVIDKKEGLFTMERQDTDLWYWINGLNSIRHFTNKSASTAQDLIKANDLDISSDKDHPLAIWYGKLLPACENEIVTEHIINNLL